MAREWDATTYDDLTLPHVEWGQRVLDRMGLAGSELVLDAGCGTGRDAAALRERWPAVRLVALDGSQQMLDVARGHLGDDGVTYLHADLTRPLSLEEPVDAVMSVAAFHWIADHAALFANLAGVMRPGAQLTFDCGGRGNVRNLTAAIAQVTGEDAAEWEFADDIGTRSRLADAGFEVGEVLLRPSPFRCEDPDVFESFLAAVCLGGQLAGLPESEHAAFVREVRLAFPEPVVDYVRLEAVAVRR
jgi:trans-aconitate 2-methyltransferase